MTARVTVFAKPALRRASTAICREFSRRLPVFRMEITKPVFPVS